MQVWSQFYAVIGGVAATLLGLLFVAVSINAAATLADSQEHSKRLAEQAFQNYLAVILVSLLALFPPLDITDFGTTALCLTAVRGVWVLIRAYLAVTRPNEGNLRIRSLRSHISSLIGFGMLIFAAARMALKMEDSRMLFAIATIVLLLSAAVASWELLLRIAKIKQTSLSN